MVITDCERVHENGHPYAQVSNASNVGRFEGEGAVAVLASTVDLSCVSTTKRKRREVDLGPALQPEKRKKHKSTKEEDAEIEFDAVWICVECKEAECMMDPDATDLLICDDVCRRVFHYPCAGLQYLPSEDESFVCVDCRTRKHICSFCSNYGMDGEDVYKCRKKHCGLFFHESCLSMQNIDIYVAPELEIDPKIHTVNAIADATNVPSQLSFVCPAHSCWTCTQLELKELDVQSNIADNSVRKIKNGGRGRKKAHKPVSNVFESKTESFLTVGLA